MGRKRAQRPVATPRADPRSGDGPTGAARVAWSQLAGLLAAVAIGLGLALSDVIQAARCDSDDATCALGTYLVGALVSALIALPLVARLFRLGWEWALVCAVVVVSMPLLLDVGGTWAWAAAVLAPTVGALATLGGRRGPRWRPIAVAAGAGLVIAVALGWTFFPPGA